MEGGTRLVVTFWKLWIIIIVLVQAYDRCVIENELTPMMKLILNNLSKDDGSSGIDKETSLNE